MLDGTPITKVPAATVENENFFATCRPAECTPDCENVFAMVHVSYLIRGGTRVMWTLHETFNDPPPWVFQLQVGSTGNQNADDWTDVGLPMENACYAIDPNQRTYGKGDQDTHYRVKLTTSRDIYFSDPEAKSGILQPRDWRLAKEIIRKEKLRHRYANQDGFLLKRRNLGIDCPVCLDFQTNEIRDPYCTQCWGTGKECGYYYPMACVWADMNPVSSRRHMDDQGMRGTIQDISIQARMLMLPLIDEKDVWVSRETDDRYFIQAIQNASEIRGVPLVANVELRPAPYTDIVYRIPIPQQDAWLQEHC